ncbi:MAG: hypothetical protein AAGN82_31925 [Myxococcota bacterium]
MTAPLTRLIFPPGLAMALAAIACAGDGSTTTTDIAPGRACGPDRCATGQYCVATEGARCTPLPPPGESCPEGCVLTEHCCNCTVHACVDPPTADTCADGATCACLDATSALRNCPADRRTCRDDPEGADVMCIAVALDEDPFAD